MRIELTVSGPAGSRDVAIVAPGALPLAAVAGKLAAAAGAPADARLWCGEQPLAHDTRLGESGLRTGSLLSTEATRGARRPGVVSLHVIGGPEAGRVIPLERGRLTLGRDPGCTLVLADDRASRQHAVLEVGTTALTLRDMSSTNGTTVDNVRLGPAGARLEPGQLIRIGDSLLAVGGPDDAPAALVPAAGAVLVNRPPRQTVPFRNHQITLPERAAAARPRRVQWVTAALPAVAGGAVAWATHSPQFLLFALLSPVIMVSSSLGDRVHWRRSRRRDAATYRRRRAAAIAEITAGLMVEAAARRANAPDPAAVWRLASIPSSRLWERRRTDTDHLHLRLGSAELSSVLQVRAGSSIGPAGVVPAVPLSIDLRAGPLGVAGPAEVVAGLARWLIAQLAVLHSPADVELALLLSGERAPHWAWARWLPHLGGRVASCPDEWQSMVAELTAALGQRRAARGLDARGWAGRWTVVVIDHAARLVDVPGLAALLSAGASAGLSAVCIDVDERALPASCATVARVRGETGSRVSLRLGNAPDSGDAVIDCVSVRWAEHVARALAPLVDAGADDSSALPAECRLLALLGLVGLDADQVVRRWAVSSGRPDTVLGVSGDGPLHVDLAADGPHALVAGTTGAGKSELLQALVAGLAALHPPEELTFLLVDYKGGAAFAECARLPHTAGMVTDLDPQLTRRALRSLDAELRRRERALAVAGAVDLDDYRGRRRANPLPRLVIVVDEFATLAEELPEFIRGLVGVAQRGRSLGVHLILATQRPGSAVSAEIRANTSLRIALRVTDPAESKDIVDAPDAAAIERSRPGRAYLRAGSALTCFQTARIGGAGSAPTAPAVELLRDWRRRPASDERAHGGDDLLRLVEVLRDAARSTGRSGAASPWLDPLPVRLPVRRARSALPPTAPASVVPIGLVDLPAAQAQPALTVDLAGGSSVLVAGAPGSGRTSALATVTLGAAVQLAPDRLEIYVVDTSGALVAAVGELPHVTTALGPGDIVLVETLLRRLDTVVTRRLAAGHDQGRADSARLLLILDAWDSVLAGQEDVEAGRCSELLIGLLRAGATAGLTTVAAGGRSLLAPRFAGAFDTRLLLRLTDRNDYGLVGIPPREVPAVLPPGRGVRAADAAELQIAHVGATLAPADPRGTARAISESWPGVQPSAAAVRIRSLPGSAPLSGLPRDTDQLRLGLAGDAAAPLAIDLFCGSRRFLVAGPPRSGRSTTLCSLLVEAQRVGMPAIAAAPARSPLAVLAGSLGVRLVAPGDAAETVGAVPEVRTLLLVDDSEVFLDRAAGEQLTSWVRCLDAPLAAAVAGRCDDLATTYRGIAAEVRRSQCGLLLRPGPIDGELLGIRLGRRPAPNLPGRGLLVGEASWGAPFDTGEPVPIQVATPC